MSLQLSLDTEDQPREPRVLAIDRDDGSIRRSYVIPDAGQQTETRTWRRLQVAHATWKRIGESRDEGATVIVARHKRRSARKAYLLRRLDLIWGHKNSEPRAQDSLLGQLISNTETRLYVALISIPNRSVVIVREGVAPKHVKLIRSNQEIGWVSIVGGRECRSHRRFDRAGRG